MKQREDQVLSCAYDDEKRHSVCYDIFCGVSLTYMDMHIAQHHKPPTENRDILEIDYCHEGCMECTAANQAMVLGSGDVLIHQKINSTCETSSSLSHFHGISIAIDLCLAEDGLSHMLHDLDIDLQEMKEKYCCSNRMTLFHANNSLIQIFSALYSAPEDIRSSYAKAKMPELIFFLNTFQPDGDACINQRSFSRYAVAQTKAVGHYLAENTEQQTTIAELSKRFCISQTVLKECFRRMYGENIAAFSRRLRIKKAAELLLATDMNILDIAVQVGYSNASKFAKVFCEFTGATPKEYRRKMGQMGSNSGD